MEKDWSTINVQRDQAFGGDSDAMRQRLVQHHEAISSLIESAPTEELARRYIDVRAELDGSIQRLDDLSRPVAGAASAAQAVSSTAAAPRPGSWTNTRPPEPGYAPTPLAAEPPRDNRTIILLLLGIVALTAFAFLGWRYLKTHDRAKVVEPPATTTIESTADSRIVEAPPVATATAAAADGLVVTPANQSFGKVKKGTRIVKKFQIVNNSTEALTLSAGRSQCHCLWFQFTSKVPAGAKVPLSVTLDGARAKKGSVSETVTLTSKEHPDEKTTFGVTANVE